MKGRSGQMALYALPRADADIPYNFFYFTLNFGWPNRAAFLWYHMNSQWLRFKYSTADGRLCNTGSVFQYYCHGRHANSPLHDFDAHKCEGNNEKNWIQIRLNALPTCSFLDYFQQRTPTTEERNRRPFPFRLVTYRNRDFHEYLRSCSVREIYPSFNL